MKLSHRFLILLLTACFATGLAVHAQTDTIRLKDKRLNTAALKPGLNQYLIYFQDTKRNRQLGFWFWLRNIGVENRNGEKVFAITQHWYGNDTNAYRTVYSINKMADFAPVYHSETKGGKVFACNWGADKITGADSVALNNQKAFSFDFKTPNFNWNLDIETFEMLPLAAGKNFVINFYDAGLSPPEYVTYKVTGSEVIATLDNQKVDCWKLYTEGDNGKMHYTETYWISKKNHEFLMEEDHYGDQIRYKIKMLSAAPDLLQKFAR